MSADLPSFAARQAVLLEVESAGQLIGWRAAIDAVQDERLVLIGTDDEPVPEQVREGAHVAVTSVSRYGVYTVDAVVSRRSQHTVAVHVPRDLEPVQRRQYVRVESGPLVRCLLLDERTNQFTPFDAHVHDIGGGGIALEADVIAPRDAIAVCSLALPGERPLVTVGTVLEPMHRRRGEPRRARDGSSDEEYLLRLQFTAISEFDRERLIRFVFACMRAGHANGAGAPDGPPPGPRPGRSHPSAS